MLRSTLSSYLFTFYQYLSASTACNKVATIIDTGTDVRPDNRLHTLVFVDVLTRSPHYRRVVRSRGPKTTPLPQ